ncbi:peptidase M24, structural domain-containing protein [Chlorella virus XW01]|nr:peptidase M24, structural domain-containing protein [Chlorella virus XW01]
MFSIEGFYQDLELYGINNNNSINNIINNSNDIQKLGMKDSLILAGNIHKKVRSIIKKHYQPNLSLNNLADLIESTTKNLTKNNGINYGIGFPSGLSLNEVAAHYSPHYYEPGINDYYFKTKDTLKIDFGVEVNGWIIDSAFTITFNPEYLNLLTAVQEATYTGIKNCGIDVRIKEWSKDIEEVMTSYEVNDKQVVPIETLGGHNIKRKIIHGGVFLPAKYLNYYPTDLKFEEGLYAIETFGSLGSGITVEKGENSLYAINPIFNQKIKDTKLFKFHKKLLKRFETLPFSSRYLLNDIYNLKDYNKKDLDILVEKKVLKQYPPLVDTKNGMTAQYEHTILLTENSKINLSKGDDY